MFLSNTGLFSGRIGINRTSPNIQTLFINGRNVGCDLPNKNSEIPSRVIFSSNTDSNIHFYCLDLLYHPSNIFISCEFL